jgi:hypothetical protein
VISPLVDDGPAVQVQEPPPEVVAHVPLLVLQLWLPEQAAQAAPPLPHRALVSLANGTQVVPLQQPLAHELALQAHLPDAQVVPVAQAAQAAPAVPQVALLEVWQWPFASQHPLGQEVALQTHLPPLQAWPVAQAAQAAPLVPQADAVSAVVTQVVPLQQPVGQEVALQAHCPLLPQACPDPQATQAAPAVPQVVVDEV